MTGCFDGAEHDVKGTKIQMHMSEPVYTGATNPNQKILTAVILTFETVTLFCDLSFVIEAKTTEWFCISNHSRL